MTGSTTFFDQITLVQDNSVTVFSGSFQFSQPFTETVDGAVTTYAALAGPTATLHLSNGLFLNITPLVAVPGECGAINGRLAKGE
jgi:hypothetical protein